jgi:hypothetical protein
MNESIKAVAMGGVDVARSDISELCKQHPLESITYSNEGAMYNLVVVNSHVFVVGEERFGCSYVQHTMNGKELATIIHPTRADFFIALNALMPKNWKAKLIHQVVR